MKNLKKLVIVISVFLVFAMVLSGCGGGGGASAPEPASPPPAQQAEEPTGDAGSDGISSSFKAQMDAYERFFDTYVDIAEKYQDNPTDPAIMTDYLELLEEFTEMLEELENLEEADWTTEELQYYLDVLARVLQKIAAVQ
ncbi:MAG: hypothetical protein FWH32_04270 [Clostridiales bacterium]|nr:hypothetical protein [Clostridiales bacterium]